MTQTLTGMPNPFGYPVDMKDKITHFGFTDAPYEEKVRKIASVCHSVADKYDIMNELDTVLTG